MFLSGIVPLKTIKMFTLYFNTNETQLIVSGKTFPIKDQLKNHGGRWDAGRWLLPLNADSPLFRANLVEQCRLAVIAEKKAKEDERAEQIKRIAYLHSPEFVKAAVASNATGDRTYFWICCEQCRIVSYERQSVWCNACGADSGGHIEGYFVRGRLRTGD